MAAMLLEHSINLVHYCNSRKSLQLDLVLTVLMGVPSVIYLISQAE